MNPLHKRALLILLTCMLSAPACGPFFPDTVLDLPQAALRVRSTCLLDEVIAIDRSHGRGISLRPAGLEMIRRSQMAPSRQGRMPYDEWLTEERRKSLQPVIAAGMSEESAMATPFGEGATRAEGIELAVLLLENRIASVRVAEIITSFTTWRTALPRASLDGPWAVSAPPRTAPVAPPEFPEVPCDITAYWKAAGAWRGGDSATARAAWQAILDLPENQNRHRVVWAAWMLAKTSPDQASAVPFHRKTVSLAESGHADALNLSALAMGWLAIAESDPVSRLKCYLDAACMGNEDMLVSLRRQLAPILADHAAMVRAAADPPARETVTALLYVMSHNLDIPTVREDKAADDWLSLLEKQRSEKPSAAAAKAAWICYGRADFDGARRWLALAPQDAGEVLWLRAKLALRDGRLDAAARLFARAAPTYQFASENLPPDPRFDDLFWYDHGPRRDGMRGQFHTDRAIVHIGRGEFLRAMDFLAKASYQTDAAYLAERVLTTDELVSWVKRHRPAPKADPGQPIFLLDADGTPRRPDGEWHGDRLRYLLARRLAREFRFREAADFMPHALRRVFDHYVLLHREVRDGPWPDETRAIILWRRAKLHRELGMEVFGYEGSPDHAASKGAFEALDYLGRRSRMDGWHFSWQDDEPGIKTPNGPEDIAFPPVSREEIRRITPQLADGKPRFHYRRDAAEIAWRAAKLLPDNDPRTLFILHEAGRWLVHRDPKSADRFYQEIIRRCSALPLGRELDRRRWFLPHPPQNPLPELPAGLRFASPDVAAFYRK